MLLCPTQLPTIKPSRPTAQASVSPLVEGRVNRTLCESRSILSQRAEFQHRPNDASAFVLMPDERFGFGEALEELAILFLVRPSRASAVWPWLLAPVDEIDGNAPQKHVAPEKHETCLAGTDCCAQRGGGGTNATMLEAGKSKTCVWRWQERFPVEGFRGPSARQDATFPLPTLGSDIAELTVEAPPGATTHWTGAAIAQAAGLSVSSVQRISRDRGLQPHRFRLFKLSQGSRIRRQLAPLDGTVIGRNMQRHWHREFIRFLNTVERDVPPASAILDNYATHKDVAVMPVAGPKSALDIPLHTNSASWFNAVEASSPF